jgi:HTH-type transcriptional regulator / antitoxin HigA
MSAAILDETKYGRLLAKALPHVIHNDDELEHFTQVLLEIDEIAHQSREQVELAELLTTLIEQYEAQHYSLPKASPTELIQFLLDQRAQSPKDLWPILGGKGNTSEILSSKRTIGVTTAAKLGEFFKVAPELFVEWKAISASSSAFGD